MRDDYKPRFGGNLTRPKNTQYQCNNTPWRASVPKYCQDMNISLDNVVRGEGEAAGSVCVCVCV